MIKKKTNNAEALSVSNSEKTREDNTKKVGVSKMNTGNKLLKSSSNKDSKSSSNKDSKRDSNKDSKSSSNKDSKSNSNKDSKSSNNKDSKSYSKNNSNSAKFGSSYKNNTTNKQDSKSKKSINSTNVKVKKEASITDWFFMCKQEITAKDIAEYLKQLNLGELDLWEELNILALEIGDRNSIDFEGLTGGFKGEDDIAFMKRHGFVTVFTVTASEDSTSIRGLFDGILKQFPGAFCADTEDFKPCIMSRD
ncbi:MAG: hypothetical protein K0R05_213 [Anaerocolumna sp.]|jgi:hypothetical protein|nr:hypothetical protein [Anaerocolumna sp.]